MSLLKADMPLKDLATWFGQYARVTLTRATKIEEYTVRALAKMAHTSLLGTHLHEVAQNKDRLDH